MPYTKGRRLTEETVRDIASNYKTLTDWNDVDPSSVRAAKRLGIFEELKLNKTFKGDSTPQRMVQFILDQILQENSQYNTRKIIPPFEIDIYYPKYKIGVEYNGYAFHFGRYYDEEREQRKRIAEKNKNDIVFFHINEPHYLKMDEYENFVKKSILDILPDLNKITNLSIMENKILKIDLSNLNNIVPFNWDGIFNLIDSYESGSHFRIKNQSLYHTIIRKGRKDILKYISDKTISYHKNKVLEKYEKLYKIVITTYDTYREFLDDKKFYEKCNGQRGFANRVKKFFHEKNKQNFDTFMEEMLNKHETYRDFYQSYEEFNYVKKLGVSEKIKKAFYIKNKDKQLIQWFDYCLTDDEKIQYVINNYNLNSFVYGDKIFDYYKRRNMIDKIKQLLI